MVGIADTLAGPRKRDCLWIELHSPNTVRTDDMIPDSSFFFPPSIDRSVFHVISKFTLQILTFGWCLPVHLSVGLSVCLSVPVSFAVVMMKR